MRGILTALLMMALAALVVPAAAQHDDHGAGESRESSPALDLGALDNGEGGEWTCPMHPGIRRDEPGSCPICGMELVRRDADTEAGHVIVGEGIRQAMNLRTEEVRHGRLWRRIDTVGEVRYDESRVHHIHPRTEGWIQALDVIAEGEPVRAGQRLFTLYSPSLVQAQEEFLHALDRGAAGMITAARERLQALDVQPEVIAWLEENRRPRQAVPWVARHDGFVSRLGVRHGMYVTPGTEIMEIADLEQVWVDAEVFDRHAQWLAEDQPAEVRFSHQPGQARETTVAWIYPRVDSATRAVRVRLVLDNPEADLRPGMWADVRILAGPADDQVYIPAEALIRTGRSVRVVVHAGDGHFQVREVTAGMRSGEFVAISAGLEPGEEVVTSGQFLIDSEANLRAAGNRLGGHEH